MGRSSRLAALAWITLALTSTSCVDPVHDDAVDALGGETGGIDPGPRHRAGQDCLACHDGRGPGKGVFSVAGTIYATRSGTAPLDKAQVTVQDTTGAKRVFMTNDVGNFYVTKDEWSPTFPLFVRLDSNGKKKVMQTRIDLTAGCGFCHAGPRPNGDPVHMPPVFLEDR